jgi:hypothetical protein
MKWLRRFQKPRVPRVDATPGTRIDLVRHGRVVAKVALQEVSISLHGGTTVIFTSLEHHMTKTTSDSTEEKGLGWR